MDARDMSAGAPQDGPAPVRKVLLVVLAAAISILFLWMIRAFLIALLLAAITAGGLRPVYKRLLGWVGRRKHVAAGLTLFLLSLLVIVPLLAFGVVVAQQAVDLGSSAGPWVREQLATPSMLDDLSRRFPELDALRPYRDQILEKLGEAGSMLGAFAVGVATSAAQGVVEFLLLLFVMLYATFYFLTDGQRLLQKLLYYSPLPPEDEDKMVGRFLSVARATVKGTLVIGLVQGLLGGLAFWVAGVHGAAFWGTVMGVLSVIPGLGPVVVWVPVVVYLFAIQNTGAAVGLLLWCALVVGSIDNFLRPWLVGKDTKLPDLMVLLSTLGGLVLFGPVGFIIGPIVAALFVTVWDIYGEVFSGVLPEPTPLSVPFSIPGRHSDPPPATKRSEAPPPLEREQDDPE
jgi:predicted PurR-regulated permease PerM